MYAYRTSRQARAQAHPARQREEAMKRRDVLKLGAAAALGAGGLSYARPSAAQAKLELKAADVHPAGYPTVVAVENMGKKLEQATNGRISVKMFGSMQLGGEKETIEQCQVGAIQLGRVSVGAVGQELLDKVTNNPNTHLVGLCWMDAGARNMYDTKHPIKSVDDIKGLKVRVMGNPMFVDMMNAIGGNGVAMGYDQVFSALQTGVVDGAENNPPSFYFDNHYQVAKYYTITEHLIVPEILVFSGPSWAKLDKGDQELITKFGREAQLDERKLWMEKEKDAIAKMKAAGIEIDTISDEDKKKLQEAVKPVWDKYGAKYADLIKRIQAVT